MPAAGGGCACVHRLEGDWGGVRRPLQPHAVPGFLWKEGREAAGSPPSQGDPFGVGAVLHLVQRLVLQSCSFPLKVRCRMETLNLGEL